MDTQKIDRNLCDTYSEFSKCRAMLELLRPDEIHTPTGEQAEDFTETLAEVAGMLCHGLPVMPRVTYLAGERLALAGLIARGIAAGVIAARGDVWTWGGAQTIATELGITPRVSAVLSSDRGTFYTATIELRVKIRKALKG